MFLNILDNKIFLENVVQNVSQRDAPENNLNGLKIVLFIVSWNPITKASIAYSKEILRRPYQRSSCGLPRFLEKA